MPNVGLCRTGAASCIADPLPERLGWLEPEACDIL